MSDPLAAGPPYDLAVIGGGIHGAGVAQAAAAAGHRVLLIERDGWGSGTSSKSTKLIHGGLRYLANGELRLVRESLRERRILERIAPELVRPDRFHVPLYRDSRLRPWQLRLGLALYWALAGLRPGERFSRVPRGHWPQFAGLRQAGLQALFAYRDARTDDRLLTAAVVASAAALAHAQGAPERKSMKPSGAASAKDTDTLDLEKRVSDALGLKVTVSHRDPGGTVQIRYNDLDQLDEVMRRLGA